MNTNTINESLVKLHAEVPRPHPAISDLNDWIFENHPAVYAATQYLSDPYDCWLEIWHGAGRPVDGFESALWD